MTKNLDAETVKSFGDEGSRFDQSELSADEAIKIFDEYFAVFPWDRLSDSATRFDMGCGTGRWAKRIAPRVGHLHCIDPSSAFDVVRAAIAFGANVTFHCASVDESPFPLGSQDFGYSLGVLHHVPNTSSDIRAGVAMLKLGAPFKFYLYYAFDNRSLLFRLTWRCSDLLRRAVCKLPSKLKHMAIEVLARLVFYPMVRLSLFVGSMGCNLASITLTYYRNHSFYTMRTDSRDSFGMPLEQCFTRKEIASMLGAAGLADVYFSELAPHWRAVDSK